MGVKSLYLIVSFNKDNNTAKYSYFLSKCQLTFGRVLYGEARSLRNQVYTIMVQISQSSQFGNKLIIHSSIDVFPSCAHHCAG